MGFDEVPFFGFGLQVEQLSCVVFWNGVCAEACGEYVRGWCFYRLFVREIGFDEGCVGV